eukprot:3883174-Pyramimonas_sp.AAC.1
MRMQGPWTPMSKLLERGKADEGGQGWVDTARLQGYPREGCPSLSCELTVPTRRVVRQGGRRGGGGGEDRTRHQHKAGQRQHT